MFTGLIEEVGEINTIRESASSIKLGIKAAKIMKNISIGDSVAVNGVCLTVTSIEKGEFDVMPETKRITSLKNLKIGSRVNLERALALGDRFGGHIVSGHVDGAGIVDKIRKDDIAIEFVVKVDTELASKLIYKGSVAVDGVSLTCGEVGTSCFKFYLIPHTQEKTTLTGIREGNLVNIECDIVGKYIQNFINIQNVRKKRGITEEFLTENGFA
ncbi:riboflavin synthase [Clostridium guangxiense]|uniref:riboflavin synthase n=1 Tax=Clostridium guangxiense TaxID=1662055 RepID=UPI001E3F7830|nr:riboflavin synthase [Clostridium guangxiense]MCD2347601.1 riboflavin synthase [Clostridium guangxiense]